jgi:hypothetical protein
MNIGPGKFGKTNECRALNKQNVQSLLKKLIKFENIGRPQKEFQNLINAGPLIRL